MRKHSLMETFEESLYGRSMLRSELTTKDSPIEEQRKENEVNVKNYVTMYVRTCLLQVV